MVFRNTEKRLKFIILVIIIAVIGIIMYICGKQWWDLYVEISGVVLAVAAAILAYREIKIEEKGDRKDTFLFINKCLNTNQNEICNYIKKQSGVDANAFLIHKENWMRLKDDVIPIRNVNLRAGSNELVMDEKRSRVDREFRKTGFLPNQHGSVVQNLLMYTDMNLYDAPSYFLDDIYVDENNQVITEVSKGYYFWFVNTCFPYGIEAAYNCFYNKAMKRKLLQLREKYPIFDFRNRYASFGIVTLVVILNADTPDKKKQHYYLLHKRGAGVSESQGLFNAVPGCTFQPTSGELYGDLQEELNGEGIAHTITREFLEEIKSVEEFSVQTSPERISNEPLLKIVEDNCFYLGGGINPINAYFEMLTVLFLDMNDQRVKDFFKGTAKNNIRKALNPNAEGAIEIKEFEDQSIVFYMKNSKSTPALKEICYVLKNNKTIQELLESKYSVTDIDLW